MQRHAVFAVITLLASAMFSEVGSANEGMAFPTPMDEALSVVDEHVHWCQAETVLYSASRHEEMLFETPAPAYVLTSERIRRSGVTSLPEVLRLIPGMIVARHGPNRWALGVRGGPRVSNNNLLVLVDGRSIYTPDFGGVWWEAQDFVLEDIERIEMIRGPGATLWGPNALTGIINIITKSAANTHGGFLKVGGGNEDQAFGTLRYGGVTERGIHYRAHGKFLFRDSFHEITPNIDPENDSEIFSGGLRMDWEPGTQDRFMLQGSFVDLTLGVSNRLAVDPLPSVGDLTRIVNDDWSYTGGNLLWKWDHEFDRNSVLNLQMYYDRYEFRQPNRFKLARDTFDLDIQQSLVLHPQHDILLGLEYRITSDRTEGSDVFRLRDSDRTINIVSTFIQDRVELAADRLYLTLGSKFEYHELGGFHVQPSARIAYLISRRQTLWISAARAYRPPNRFTDNAATSSLPVELAPQTPISPRIVGIFDGLGSPDTDEDHVTSLDIGHRIKVTDNFSLDIVGFYNEFRDLVLPRLVSSSVSFPSPDVQVIRGVAVVDNTHPLDVEGLGIEATVDWEVTDYWRLYGGYSWSKFEAHQTDPMGGQSAAEDEERLVPNHRAFVQSILDLPWALQCDVTLSYMDSISTLSNIPGLRTTIPSYIRADLRLGWTPKETLEFSVAAQNLFDNRHPEFGDASIGELASEVERSYHASVKWRF